jgi:hypothetical protein
MTQGKPAPTTVDLLISLNAMGMRIAEQLDDTNAALERIVRATEQSARHVFLLALPKYIMGVVVVVRLILALMTRR